MDRDNILNKLQTIFRDVFNVDNLIIDETFSPDDFEPWDSFAQITLLSIISNEFKINFDIDELANIVNIKDMCDSIQSKLN